MTLYCKNVLTFILTLLQNYLGVSKFISTLLKNYLGVSDLHHSWPRDGCCRARPQCCPVLERLQRGWSLVKYFCYNVEIFFQVGVIIMVPALLGLKGNLEMTLASRLSTAQSSSMYSGAPDTWNTLLRLIKTIKGSLQKKE